MSSSSLVHSVCIVGYRQEHSRRSSDPRLDFGLPSSGSGYHSRGSRKLPYSGYYAETKNRESISEDRRDLDRRRGSGKGRGYIPDSAESGSTDPDTYDNQDMEVRITEE